MCPSGRETKYVSLQNKMTLQMKKRTASARLPATQLELLLSPRWMVRSFLQRSNGCGCKAQHRLWESEGNLEAGSSSEPKSYETGRKDYSPERMYQVQVDLADMGTLDRRTTSTCLWLWIAFSEKTHPLWRMPGRRWCNVWEFPPMFTATMARFERKSRNYFYDIDKIVPWTAFFVERTIRTLKGQVRRLSGRQQASGERHTEGMLLPFMEHMRPYSGSDRPVLKAPAHFCARRPASCPECLSTAPSEGKANRMFELTCVCTLIWRCNLHELNTQERRREAC